MKAANTGWEEGSNYRKRNLRNGSFKKPFKKKHVSRIAGIQNGSEKTEEIGLGRPLDPKSQKADLWGAQGW